MAVGWLSRLAAHHSEALNGALLQPLAVDQGALRHKLGDLDVAGYGVARSARRFDRTGRPEASLTSHDQFQIKAARDVELELVVQIRLEVRLFIDSVAVFRTHEPFVTEAVLEGLCEDEPEDSTQVDVPKKLLTCTNYFKSESSTTRKRWHWHLEYLIPERGGARLNFSGCLNEKNQIAS